MPPDKMPPPTVEFVFLFFKCCFSLLLHALTEAANCVKRIKIDLNIIIIIIIISQFYSNTKLKHAIYGNTHNSQTV